mmetsp:Transcript_18989/g.23386  ORF Transcript_18989/g.23386 Transcript_18989/m.23386 type:complete len:85 (+) Transcript_18989:192-446(+)
MQMKPAETKETLSTPGLDLRAAGQLDHLVRLPLHRDSQPHTEQCKMQLTKHLPKLLPRRPLVWKWTLTRLTRHPIWTCQTVSSL